MSERIDNLGMAVGIMEGCHFKHVESVPVRETFRGEVVWEGVVEVFDLIDHPKAKRAYAWQTPPEGGEERFVHVLQLHPVKDPLTAVRAYIASLGQK